jgi:membrane-bound ClpP family serine protease
MNLANAIQKTTIKEVIILESREKVKYEKEETKNSEKMAKRALKNFIESGDIPILIALFTGITVYFLIEKSIEGFLIGAVVGLILGYWLGR